MVPLGVGKAATVDHLHIYKVVIGHELEDLALVVELSAQMAIGGMQLASAKRR